MNKPDYVEINWFTFRQTCKTLNGCLFIFFSERLFADQKNIFRCISQNIIQKSQTNTSKAAISQKLNEMKKMSSNYFHPQIRIIGKIYTSW